MRQPSLLRAEHPDLLSGSRSVHMSSPAWALVAVVLAIGAYALLFGWLSLERYWSYQMHALDMGNMGQAAWNTIHGHPFRFTNMRLPYAIEAWRTTTRLSFHVEALFPVISLVYIAYPHPESLLVLQTAALAIGGIAVYLLALDVVRSAALAIAFVLVYLLFPTLEALNLYEFHPVALATPLLLFAFLFAWRRQYLPFVLCCLAAMGTKEQIGLIVVMLGLYVAFVNRERRVGLSMAAVGGLWSLFAVSVVERHFRQPGTVTYTHTRYGYLGHGIHGALNTVLHDPGAIGNAIFVWPKLGYLLRLLVPDGFLALLGPQALILGAPTLALNLLSTDFHMYSGVGDNSAELVSVLLIGSILGARLVLRATSPFLSRRTVVIGLTVYLLAAALWGQREYGFTPLGPMFSAPSVGPHQRLADRFLALVPAGVPVSTQDQIDPHLSSREYLYLFEDTGRQAPDLPPANRILLDVSAPTYPLPSYQIHDRAERWIHHSGWGIAAARDGLLLIQKGAHRRSLPPRFFTYARADGVSIRHRLRGSARGMFLLGYDLKETDQPNHPIPNRAYTFFLRPHLRLRHNVQPAVFQVMHGTVVGCVHEPLGLAWLPTSRWHAGHTYAVRMDPLETTWQSRGTAELYVGIVMVSSDPQPSCSELWVRHRKLWSLGRMSIGW